MRDSTPRRGPVSLLIGLAALACCSEDARTPLPGASAAPSANASAPLPNPLPAVAAKVNEQPILTRNVRIAAERALGRGEVPDNEQSVAYRRATQSLIDRELLFQEAERRHLSVTAKQLEEAENQIRVGYKDDTEWRAFLAKQGMDEQAFRAELRIQHTVQALMEQVAEKISGPVGDAEARAFYDANPQAFESGERFRARHILLRVPPDATPARRGELRALAAGILSRIHQGEAFAGLARKYSQDADSSGNGGELPAFSKGQMVPAFAEAVGALKPTQVSELVETPFGFHIIQLHERLPSQKAAFEQVRDQVSQHLLAQRRQQALQGLVQSLRAQAKVETFL